ncbi:NAD(P)H-dependent flavin oxidoreductase [Empedobacter brevis]|uniref:NAD(P)H-dependent flavin oxidoreductase n=1 Tax=Empedobacter brevis TaxID=247 RepID=UPI0028ABA598|nr:nitronate monooxygenase [Empedobacter brevis]
MTWQNDLTDLFGVKYPVIQAPMFGVTTPQMVAGASRIGCLGSLPIADLDAEDALKKIHETKKITDKPFAVNIFVNDVPEITLELKQKYNKVRKHLKEIAFNQNFEVDFPEIETVKPKTYKEKIDLIIQEKCRILSFIFGILDKDSIEKLKENNVCLVGTCTTVEEAIQLEKAGIDVICVQGIEAGGHRGTFDPNELPQIGGFSLLPHVRDVVKTPLIYAGGIYNAQTLLAARTLGADGFQVGSLLLCSQESALRRFEKDRLENVREDEITLTKSFSGRYARGIRNEFIDLIENTDFILPYPYQNKLTNFLRKASKIKENTEFTNLWLGHSYHHFEEDSTTNLLQNLIHSVEKL